MTSGDEDRRLILWCAFGAGSPFLIAFVFPAGGGASSLSDLQAHLIYEESHAEADLKDAATLEEEHGYALELQRLLKQEQEDSAALVDSAIEGVVASYEDIYPDTDWPGAGRWAAPENIAKTDVYEWPVQPGSDFGSLDLALGRRRRR